MPGYLNHTSNNKASLARPFRMFGDKISHRKPLDGAERYIEILNIFKATWHFQIHRGFVIIHEEMKEKEMSPFEGLDDKGTCPPQLSTHSVNSPSTNTKYLHAPYNCWRYSCGTLFYA